MSLLKNTLSRLSSSSSSPASLGSYIPRRLQRISSQRLEPESRPPPYALFSRCTTRAATFLHTRRPPSARGKHDGKRGKSIASLACVAGGCFFSFFIAYGAAFPRTALAEAPPRHYPEEYDDEEESSPPPPPRPPPRKIRLSEVHAHGRDAAEFWVVHNNRIYDITGWVPSHPGGSVILRAAGGNIDAYWKIFTIHQKPEVYEILEQYFIGVVDERDLVDGKVPLDEVDDPFVRDPTRDPRLRVLSQRPCNAETRAEDGGLGTYLTANEVFYVRNHLWVPFFDFGNNKEDGDEGNYRFTVELPDGEEKEYTLDSIRRKFKEHTITATLQCSGNRRAHMTEGARHTQGLQWGVGAIGNAEWTGVLLRDVLKDAGFESDGILPSSSSDDNDDGGGVTGVRHAQFSGAEAYGASIPIEKAIDKRGDVLLAYKMNGQSLPRDHGYPLRVIAPGHVAARSVKWVSRITLSEEESQSQWQQKDYKCFGPNQTMKDVEWEKAPAIQEMPVQSAVTSIRDVTPDDTRLLEVYGRNEECVGLEGYSYSGGGRRIIRVDVSADDGRTWQQAELAKDEAKGHKAWGWQRWSIAIPKSQTGRWFAVKAVDETYQSQPEDHASNWNFRGNLCSAWHRVQIKKADE